MEERQLSWWGHLLRMRIERSVKHGTIFGKLFGKWEKRGEAIYYIVFLLKNIN